MKIGIDIDDTLYDFNSWLIRELNLHTWKNYKLEDIKTWCFKELYWLEIEEIKEIVKKSDLYSYWEISQENKNFLLELSKKWYKIHFITSRFLYENKEYNTIYKTINWLQLNDIEESITFSFDKWKTCKVLGITHFVDDSLINLLKVKKDSPETKLFKINKPWNWEFEKKRLIQSEIFNEDEVKELEKSKIVLNELFEIKNHII